MPISPSFSLILVGSALATGVVAGWWARGAGEAADPVVVVAPAETAPGDSVGATLAHILAVTRDGGNEVDIPFSRLVESATGKKILPFEPGNPVHAAAVEAVASALDATLHEMNAPDSPVLGLRRINEASSFFEDSLRKRIDALADFGCAFPENPAGKVQRSGYPDLRMVHEPSGTVFYLDPKLFEATSRESTLRTFYFTTDPDSLKVRDDGLHLLLGIAHDGTDGKWKFVGWDIVDLSRLDVQLKAEFQTGNHRLYAPERVLRRSKSL